MTDPALGVWLSVQSGFLDINVLIRGIEVGHADCGCLLGFGVFNADGLEERCGNEVDVLARVGEKSQHGEHGECTHGAGVVVSWKTGLGRVERMRDVVVSPFSRQTWTAGIVVIVHGEEDGLVADVSQSRLVEEVKAGDEFISSTK